MRSVLKDIVRIENIKEKIIETKQKFKQVVDDHKLIVPISLTNYISKYYKVVHCIETKLHSH